MNHYNDQAVQVAQRFLQQHRDEHLDTDRKQLVDRCAMHLCDVFDISQRAAVEISIKVWGEACTRKKGWRIDIERSTAVVLVMVSDDGRRAVMSTADELVAVLAQKHNPTFRPGCY